MKAGYFAGPLGWFYTFVRQKNAVQHFIIYKAREEKIITLGLWQKKARKENYPSSWQSQRVERRAPLRQVTGSQTGERQQKPLGRAQRGGSRAASGLPEGLLRSPEVCQLTEHAPHAHSLTRQTPVVAQHVSELSTPMDGLGGDTGSPEARLWRWDCQQVPGSVTAYLRTSQIFYRSHGTQGAVWQQL